MLFCGIDWSDQTLEYHLRHAERGELVKGTVAASVAGLADLYATLELHTRPEEIGVAIETCHGVWIQALLDRGYKIYPVSPKAADNFRKALNDSGVKTDAIDSKTLALFLVTFHHDRTPLRPDDPEIVKIRILCQDRLRLSEERVAKVNELTAAIKGYYPAFLGVFGCLDSDIALDFLIQYPTQRQFRKLSAHRFVAWLGRRHYTCRRRIDEMVEKLHAPAFEVAEHLQDSKKHLISYLGRSLKLLNAEIDERDEEINDLLKSLPESDWILSLPGAGGVLGPSLLACIGRDPERFASTGEARAFMGTRRSPRPAARLARFTSAGAAGNLHGERCNCLPINRDIAVRGRPSSIRSSETAATGTTRRFGPWRTGGSRYCSPCSAPEAATMRPSTCVRKGDICSNVLP